MFLLFLNTRCSIIWVVLICAYIICIPAASYASANLSIAKDNSQCLYGYKNDEGEWVIKAQYVMAGRFIYDRAIVVYGDKNGVIDTTGKFIIEPAYDALQEGHTGSYIFTHNGGLQGVIQADKSKVLLDSLDGIFNAQEGYSITKNGLWGYAAIDGKVIIPPIYKQLQFGVGHYRVAGFNTDSTAGYFNLQGKKLFEGRFSALGPDNAYPYFFVTSSFIKHRLYNWDGKPLYHDVDSAVIDYRGFAIVIENGKYNLIDTAGDVITMGGGYDFILPIVNRNNLLIKQNNRYGIINAANKILVPPLYDSIILPVYDFYYYERPDVQFFMTVIINGKQGVINAQGQAVVDTMYDYILGGSLFGIAVVAYKKGLLTAIDLQTHAQVALSTGCEFLNCGRSNQVGFNINGKSGIADETGKVIVAPVYDNIVTWGDKFIVREKGKWGIVDGQGKTIIAPSFNKSSRIGESINDGEPEKVDDIYLYLMTDKGLVGLVDSACKWKIKPQYINVSIFNNGFFWVQRPDSSWSFVNASGKMISKEKYDFAGFFNEGYSRVEKEGLAGIINDRGKVIIQCKYKTINKTVTGNYWCANNLWGLLDGAGKQILLPDIEDYQETQNNTFVKQNGHWNILGSANKISPGLGLLRTKEDMRTAFENTHGLDLVDVSMMEEENSGTSVSLIKNTGDIAKAMIINDCLLNMATVPAFIAPQVGNEVELPYFADSIFVAGEERNWPSDWFTSITYRPLYVNANSFTVSKMEEVSGHQTDNVTEEISNFLFSKDSLHVLTLDELFIDTNYQEVLSVLCMQQIKTMDDVEVDCSNPTNLVPEQNFKVTKEGLEFQFTNAKHVREHEERNNSDTSDPYFYVTIPYADISSIVNKQGALKEFLLNLF